MSRTLLLTLVLAACTQHAPGEPASTNGTPLVVRGQTVPAHPLAVLPADFQADPGVAVLHYYGSGGWGIQWRGTYVLAAPYFSNHSLPTLVASSETGTQLTPNAEAIRAGVAGTPIANTSLLLIGHGHVDHTADIGALFDQGLITSKPVLLADRSTTNQLSALSPRFSCVAAIDYADPSAAMARCNVPGVRVTPIQNAHAPHLNLAGLDVAAFGGVTKESLTEAPSRAPDFKLGIPWGYLIDLLDESGAVVFRIHYIDAVGTPPHALIPRQLLAERDVDLHIGCVPGFEQSDFYPEGVLAYHRVKYVLLGHWEDFFQPQTEPFMPLRNVLDAAAMERFVDIVERNLPGAQGVVPLGQCTSTQCGPRGQAWALPVPGETFRFAVAPAH